MASLSLKHIYKVYPNGVKAVNDFNMEIEDKEFIVFVGPSGCGKSTTLRMIAGLEDITAGELKIGDLVVNDVEPKDRDIAMVFQNYALYPHMTVYDNIAFGLMMRKMPRTEIHERVMRAAEILGITEYLNRKPKEMSGGQRQRVSLGRAIVREPKVMLLDEPLSNLDAKLRTQMRTEIAKLHKQLQTTFIYVTHDQVEAMTMGTRIVVMKNGFVQQIDSPKNLYKYPENKFVAGFIGTPQMNFFDVTLLRKGEEVEIKFAETGVTVSVPYSYFYKVRPNYLEGNLPVCLGIRSEHISLDKKTVKGSQAKVRMMVSHKEELGDETLVYGNLVADDNVTLGAKIVVKTSSDVECESDEIATVALNLDHLHLFDGETENSILPRVPKYNYIDCEVADGALSMLGTNVALPSAISVEDGAAEFVLPTSAIYFGGDIQAEVVDNEKVNGGNLVCLTVDDKRLFVQTEEEMPLGKTSIAFDWKQVSILRGEEEVVSAVPQTVSFDGGFIKKKVPKLVEVNDKMKKCKVVEFTLAMENAQFNAPDALIHNVLATLEANKVFGKPFRFECSPYDVAIGETGIEAEVVQTLDYGNEKIALCKIGEDKQVYIVTDRELSGTVYLTPDIDKLAVIQADIDIRII